MQRWILPVSSPKGVSHAVVEDVSAEVGSAVAGSASASVVLAEEPLSVFVVPAARRSLPLARRDRPPTRLPSGTLAPRDLLEEGHGSGPWRDD